MQTSRHSLQGQVMALLAAIVCSPVAAVADGPSVTGRVLDVKGRPMPSVTVGIAQDQSRGVDVASWKLLARTATDRDGRFALPTMPMGEYQVTPIPDGDRPLGETFPIRVVTIRAGGTVEVDPLAIPHATFSARVIDGRGGPAPVLAFDDAEGRPAALSYVVRGWIGDARWATSFRKAPGSDDRITAIVPVGLRNLEVDSFRDNIWWTWAPGAPRLDYDHIVLKRVDGDRPEITVRRMRSPSLEVRVETGDRTLPDDAVHLLFPMRGGEFTGPIATRRIPGIYRVNSGLLPGRPIRVWIKAPGFQPVMTRPFQFAEEGQRGFITLKVEHAANDENIRGGNAVSVVLKGIDGKPIPQPAGPYGPFRSIACRAVDKETGRPVADAAVTFGGEQRVNDEGEQEYDGLFQRETRTDPEGRFTILVPEMYLPDPAPKRKVDVRVTIRHPRYVSYWDTADARENAAKGDSQGFPAFRTIKLTPARTLTGRLLDADGHPLPNVHIYKQYTYDYSKPDTWIRDADTPQTHADGRFRANVPVGEALKLEFRAAGSARNYFPVRADQTDLGDIRIPRGQRITGRVLDGDGKPVPWISVTTPVVPDSTTQPNFVYTTDAEGGFRTGELPPGNYLVRVGDIHRTEHGKESPIAVKGAPGVYISVPLAIRDGGEPPELMIRPVEHVRFVATLVTTRPKAFKRAGQAGTGSLQDLGQAFLSVPMFDVKGKHNGVDWSSSFSFLALEEEGRYWVRVPKGLTEATLEFGPFIQRFRMDEKAPELFGPAYRLGTVEAGRPDIRIRRYAETTLRVRCVGDADRPVPGATLRARYVREPAMRAAGAVFEPPIPQPVAEGEGYRISLLPDEPVELTATAAGGRSGRLTAKAAEGRTEGIVIRLNPKP